jgi:hypothetical protein
MNEVQQNPTPVTSVRVQIDEFSIYSDADSPIHFSAVAEVYEAIKERFGDESTGRVLVELDLDLQQSCVTIDEHKSNRLDLVERAIEKLVAVRDQMARLGAGSHGGRCSAIDDEGGNGRCKSPHGHSSVHDFPTDEEVQAKHDAWLARARAVIKSA